MPAAHQLGISEDRIIVLTDQDAPAVKSKAASDLKLLSVEELIQEGNKLVSRGALLPQIKLANGEAKTRIAFYSSSGGTTGPPKVSLYIQHLDVASRSLEDGQDIALCSYCWYYPPDCL